MFRLSHFWLHITILMTFLATAGKSQDIRLIANDGQWESQVLYRAEIPGGQLYLEKKAFTFDFISSRAQSQIGRAHVGLDKFPDIIEKHAYHVVFSNANSDAKITPNVEHSEHYNYFIGNNPDRWAGNVKAYSQVNYEDLYPHIDLSLYSNEGYLKYDFIVKKGGDPSDILMLYDGIDADDLIIEDGALHIHTSVNEIIEERPYAYQWINGFKKEVPCEFVLKNNEVHFSMGDYDKEKDLIIDPVLKFSTLSGSTANNFGYTATYDRLGYLYSGSSVFGDGYPLTTGAYDIEFNGGSVDFAITKYDTTGTSLVYSTLLGGSSSELPHSIIVNEQDELFVLGTSSSLDYPVTTGVYQPSFAGGDPNGLSLGGLGVDYENGSDIIITRLSFDGGELLASTFVGGTDNDGLNVNAVTSYNYADEIRGEIELDENGDVYIATSTRSDDFPMTPGAYQDVYDAPQSGVLFKMDAALTGIEWSSYFGGSSVDALYSLALDSENNVVVAGGTSSSNMPVTEESVQQEYNGLTDGFIAKFNTNATDLLYSTYWGQGAYDQTYFVELDGQDNVHVFGQREVPEEDPDGMIINAGYSNSNSGQFITKFNPNLTEVIWSTTFGNGDGDPDISPTAFLVDICDRMYLSGWGGPTQGSPLGVEGMPLTADAFQSATNGGDFYLFALDSDAADIVYGSYFGGMESNEHVDGGTSRFDRKGKVYQSVCAGCQNNSDFPTSENAFSSINGGTGCNNGVFKMDFDLPAVIADFNFENSCSLEPVTFNNTSEGGTSISWDFGDNNTSNEVSPTHQYAEAGFYEVTLIISDPFSCNIADTLTQQVLVFPNDSFEMEDAFACNGDVAQLGFDPFPGGGYTYQWQPANLVSNPNISNPTAVLTETTTFTLTISNENCETPITQVAFVGEQEYNLSPPVTACNTSLDSIIAVTDYTEGSTFVWSTSPQFTDTLNASPTDDELEITITENDTYYVQINSDGCIAEEAIDVFFENLDMEAPDSITVCPNVADELTLVNTTNNNGINITWQSSDAITDQSDPFNIEVSAGAPTTIYWEAQTALGCAVGDSVILDVILMGLEVSNDTLICDGSPVSIQASSDLPGTEYIWSDTPDFSNVISENAAFNATPGTSTTYYLMAQNECQEFEEVEVNIVSEIFDISPDVFLCAGDDLTLYLVDSTGTFDYTIDWAPDAALLSADFLPSVDVSTEQNQEFIANVTTTEGCEFSDTILVEVSQLPNLVVDATADSYLIPFGTSTQLHAAPEGYSYLWSPSDDLSSATSANPNATLEENTTFNLTVTDNHPNGICFRSDTVSVRVFEVACDQPSVFVPNAFSPGDDGKNDVLRVRSAIATSIDLTIYNRWGELVFQTTDIDEGWDGYYKGKLASPAVYVYTLKVTCLDGTENIIKGNVTLLR